MTASLLKSLKAAILAGTEFRIYILDAVKNQHTENSRILKVWFQYYATCKILWSYCHMTIKKPKVHFIIRNIFDWKWMQDTHRVRFYALQIHWPISISSHENKENLAGCVRYIFAILFLKLKESTCEISKMFLLHFKSSIRSPENQSLGFWIFKFHDASPNLDFLCVRESDAAPFWKDLFWCKKHLEKGLNRGWWYFVSFFSKKSGFFGQYWTLPQFSRLAMDVIKYLSIKQEIRFTE